MIDLKKHAQKAKEKRKENKVFFKKLKKVKPKILDAQIHTLHNEVFTCTDCLKCANCCTTTGPLFTYKDINRIAKHLKLKPSAFTEKYLTIDEDKDFVLKQVPCIFLSKENNCSIYNVRP